ncbi:hypothetical protein pb186bvf_014315 [Paramecium bursaria]
MFTKEVPQTLRSRKVDRVIRDIMGKTIHDDNHIIGMMRVQRELNRNFFGSFFSHRGILLVTGNFKINASIDSRQQEQQLNRFLQQSPDEKKLRFYIIDYKDTSKVVIETVEGYDNIFESKHKLTFNNSFRWTQEAEIDIGKISLMSDLSIQIFKIYSYQMTVIQAVDLMQRTADGEDGKIGKQKTDYSTFNNNCNHQQKKFIRQVELYEYEMRNREEFDGDAALKSLIIKNFSRIQQVKIFELKNLWLGAVLYKSLLGSLYLNIKIALKDYKPFDLNYGQREFLKLKDRNMRIQQCQEMQINIEDYYGKIENLEIVQTQIKYYQNRDHPYCQILTDDFILLLIFNKNYINIDVIFHYSLKLLELLNILSNN